MRARSGVLTVARVLGAAVLASAFEAVAAGPATAVAPSGGCWVWWDAGGQTGSTSTSLAPWSDGQSDHSITFDDLEPNPGQRVTIKYTFDKGPKNGGPAASVSGEFRFSVNGKIVKATKNFGEVAGASAMPGATVTTTFVAEEGDNVVTFEGVTYTASIGGIKIDCNGQSSGSATVNPWKSPKPTNVTATVVASGETVEPEPEPTTAPAPGPPTTTAPTTAAPTTAAPAPKSGAAAKGKATFACTLEPLGTKFDYPATISISGYRAAEGDPISLTSKMSDLPGIAPLPIDGTMNVTLTADVGGKKVTLKGGAGVKAAPKAPVAIPPMKSSLNSSESEIPITVTAFTFDFPDMKITANCTADAELSKLVVGDEAPPEDGGDGGDGGGDGGGGTAGDQLPQTGGTDALPVIALVASALLLAGAAGLVLVPGRRRTVSGG
ncbi:hypothetical protein [Mumia xiangluensis]|uniref:LPXTG-motif cell wall anchor domain-containing protein n=2 Tax=Mumia TaxID=1546255 RepID=A0ABW1QNM7_9ACTN